MSEPEPRRLAGRLFAGALVLAAAGMGIGMYYLQVYGYYERLPAQSEIASEAGTIALSRFEGIDASSSPLRYRACLGLDPSAAKALPGYEGAVPLNGPGWFSCFDAEALGHDLEEGRAEARLLAGNAPYGFDRVLALYPDGRAYVWPQINTCGTAFFDGDPLPPGCPPAPLR